MQNLPNIVFIVADTARKDSMGPYNKHVSTPNIDGFAHEGIVFSSAISPSPWTAPSHASMFTGKYPSEHGIHETSKLRIRDILSSMHGISNKAIPAYLKKLGYNTLGWSANPVVSPNTGFDDGFNYFTYYDVDSHTDEVNENLRDLKISLQEADPDILNMSTTERVLSVAKNGKLDVYVKNLRMERKRKKVLAHAGYPKEKGGRVITSSVLSSTLEEPFFLFINLMEMHDPNHLGFLDNLIPGRLDFATEQLDDLFLYKEISRNKMRKIRRAYYEESKLIDNYFGRVINFLKSGTNYDNTLIILTSDHGQALREKGFYGHGTFLFDELIDVPLIVKPPKNVYIEEDSRLMHQSTSGLFNLIEGTVEGERNPWKSSDVVFSESFGIQLDIQSFIKKHINDKDFEEKLQTIDSQRKAVYKRGYKLVVNGTLGIIEEFSHGGKKVDPTNETEILDDLLNELDFFAGNSRFEIPRTNEIAKNAPAYAVQQLL